MTYLQIINAVLRRLREDEVTQWDQTEYSQMVGDFVNDAKRIVEGRWQWSGNRQIITVTTSNGVDEYSLTGFGQDGTVLSAYNDTSNWMLRKRPQAWMDEQDNSNGVSNASPSAYCFRGVDSSDDSKIQVWPVPDGVYTLNFNVSVYQADLAANDTALNIPALPVIHLAVAMLAEEKGEAQGTTSARYFEMADRFLADAIINDANKNPEELQWVEV